MRGGDIVILACWKDHFILVGENMVQHASNYISLIKILISGCYNIDRKNYLIN
jgi:hypothetical protein